MINAPKFNTLKLFFFNVYRPKITLTLFRLGGGGNGDPPCLFSCENLKSIGLRLLKFDFSPHSRLKAGLLYLLPES